MMSKENPKPLNLNDFLPYRLSIVTNKVSRSFANLYSNKFDLSVPEWRIMAVLGQNSGLCADEVCMKTEMDKVTVSRAVTKLLGKKYISRSFSQEDRRRSILELSKRGFGIYSQVVPIAREFERQLVSPLSKQERGQLEALLDKLNLQAVKPEDM